VTPGFVDEIEEGKKFEWGVVDACDDEEEGCEEAW
jgi:hypothetical protein